ncbi:hypothetical protein [Paraburkholderia sp. BL18I3N2]|uniref:hypothetical protein n=1 Tax=Paraburkholderia sp. BL18I3N2 TaxID=1938799 RepID=UPI0015E79FC1|nr:hypothetical protein [Paraburkholderia sp. BL18I3N2]
MSIAHPAKQDLRPWLMNFVAQARRGGRSTLFDHIGVMPRDLEMGVRGTPAASAPALDARRATRVPAIFMRRPSSYAAVFRPRAAHAVK